MCRVGQLKNGDQVVGSLTRVKVVKNKVAPPFRKAEFEILFGKGISKVGEIVDLGVQFGIVKKSGAWFSYEGTKLGQGRDNTKQLIADNPELAEELAAKITEAMRSADKRPGRRPASAPADVPAAPAAADEAPAAEDFSVDDEFSIEEDI